MNDYYILDGKTVITCNLLEWAEWLKNADRTVKKTKIGEIKISTVFLGLDHNYSDEGPPLLFETLVFGGPLDGEMNRYWTWEQAEEGHREMVESVTNLMTRN